jgi:bromodomain-containing factor 1
MPSEGNGLPPHPTDPSAIKSILNPIESEETRTSSVVPEAPRSPRPDPSAPIENGIPISTNGTAPPIENQPPPPPPTSSEIANGFDSSLPPLPVDAPVPPSPKAADEPPPELPAGAIPPAVSTPSVITDGLAEPALEAPQSSVPEVTPTPVLPAAPITSKPVAELQSVTPAPDIVETPAVASGSVPAPPAVEPTPAPAPPALEPISAVPTGVVEPAPSPAPAPVDATPAPVEASQLAPSNAMDIDQPESSPSSLKRPGDELEGGDGKRSRDDEIIADQSSLITPSPQPNHPGSLQATPATPALPAPEQAAPPVAGAPAVGVVPIAIPPAPIASGPSTPFTLTQHKHMLNSVRGLKKNKDGVFFLEPVDPVKFNIPAYPQIITNPMDLATVETKLIVSDPRGPPKDKSKMGKWDESKGRYNSVAEVTLDVRQIFWNTARFNGPDHIITQAAKKLDGVFTKMVNNMPLEVSLTCWTAQESRLTVSHSPLPLLHLSHRQPPVPRTREDRPSPTHLPSAAPPKPQIDRNEKYILPLRKISPMRMPRENPNDEMTLSSNGC